MKGKILIISLVVVIFIISAFVFLKFSEKTTSISDKINYFDEKASIVNNSNVVSESLELKKVKSIDAVIPIFMYHFVRDDTGGYEYPENMVRPSTLKAQLEYLKNNNHETIYISDLECLEYYKKPVALTFDDGWGCFYSNAFPLLKEYNMKATLYVITDLIGAPGYCTLDQLKELRDSGIVDIQCHTVTHPRLANLSREQVIEEITKSKEYLKDNLGIDCDTICYPYGSYNSTVLQEAKNAGYSYGLAMTGGVYYTSIHKDIYQIPRIYANRSMTINEFASYCKKSSVNVTW